jgi:zinc transporter ZupT
MFLLLVSLAALALGPVLYRVAGRAGVRRAGRVGEMLVLVAVGALVVLHILPEAVAEAGWKAMVPLVLGLLGPTLTERWLLSSVREAHSLVRVIVISGLAVHAFVDGLGLAVPSNHGEGAMHALPIAIALHRVPVGLVIWWLLRPAHGVKVASAVLAVVGIATVAGFAAAGLVVEVVQGDVLALFQAWVAGSLLHVAVHPLDAHGDDHSHA